MGVILVKTRPEHVYYVRYKDALDNSEIEKRFYDFLEAIQDAEKYLRVGIFWKQELATDSTGYQYKTGAWVGVRWSSEEVVARISSGDLSGPGAMLDFLWQATHSLKE